MRFQWIFVMLLVCVATGLGQGAGAAKSNAQRAIAAVLQHYKVNDYEKVPETGKALEAKGSWSTGLNRPEVCPADVAVPCLRLHYKEPGTVVDCAWVVLLKADGGVEFLEENADAERYLTRKLTQGEAKVMKVTGGRPVYPAIAKAARVTGEVVVQFHVSGAGTVDSAKSQGPAMLRDSAETAVKGWVFAPLMVGSKPVAFEAMVAFNFALGGVGMSF